MKEIKFISKIIALGILLFTSIIAFGQVPKKQLVTIIITPNHQDWLYKVGEDVKFTVSAVDLKDQPILNLKMDYKIGPEKMNPTLSGNLTLQNGKAELTVKGLKEPGFLRFSGNAQVDGKWYYGLVTVGFDPLSIKPIVDMPNDFKEFWDTAKTVASKIPLDAHVRLLPEKCTEKINVYEVNVQNYKLNSRIYGIVCIPKAPGKYPAILEVPSAGVKPIAGNVALAERGVITFNIEIHGIPVTLDPIVYTDLRAGALDLYATFNLDDRDEYYFKRVYLGCVRAVDYIYSLPEFDGYNIAVKGGSQGGALAIITAALDPRIKYLSSTHPALCDEVGQLQGRPASWPNLFSGKYKNFNNKPDKIATSKYFDVVNFAKLLKTPGFYTWGFNDTTCPPTNTYAAYNGISAPKELKIFKDTGHWVYPQQYIDINEWLLKKLKQVD
ncbi:acetylxylan esterase [Pedobacter sp. SD-b]|uniref:Acetylxylan esterase n=1 Tax=Pedobacter segetis TaxID=2793069 RepID=A0ABS1BL55_9SPHI|nr:acetylxylan esterase [Pedobacter segetis]MBK0383581.1 acetylxylan esterase [Pedobacter segetis]